MIKKVSRGVKKFWATLTLLSLELLVLLALFFSALFVFVAIARMVFLTENRSFDEAAFAFVTQYVSPRLTMVMSAFSYLGSHHFLIPANLVLVLYFLFVRKHRWHFIRVPSIALGSLLLMLLLKQLFNRPRPLTPLLKAAQGLSFPSGHAMMSTTFYGLLMWLAYRHVKHPGARWAMLVLCALLVICIGTSRIYLRVHYASDVLAGYCMGFMWLMLSLWILRRFEKFSSRKIEELVEEPGM